MLSILCILCILSIYTYLVLTILSLLLCVPHFKSCAGKATPHRFIYRKIFEITTLTHIVSKASFQLALRLAFGCCTFFLPPPVRSSCLTVCLWTHTIPWLLSPASCCVVGRSTGAQGDRGAPSVSQQELHVNLIDTGDVMEGDRWKNKDGGWMRTHGRGLL